MNGSYRPVAIATRLIIAANVVVFLLMFKDRGSFDWGREFLIKWGGDLGVLSLHGQYWRWLTACFVHSSAFHIFGNMTCLASFGFTLERRFGTWKFVSLYIVTGIFSVFVSSLVDPNLVYVGASGATNGLFGAICAVWLFDRSIMNKAQFASTALLALGINFLPGVGVVGHAAGFASGLLIGLALWQRDRFAPRRPASYPHWIRAVSIIGERVRAAILPRSDSAAGALVRRLVARYRGDMVFHVVADVAAIGTALLLFFIEVPTSPVSAAKSSVGKSTATSPAAVNPAPKSTATTTPDSKPVDVATLTPQSTPKSETPGVTTTPAAPVVPIEFPDDVKHPSLANFIVVNIDDSAFVRSAPTDQQKLAAAARALRSQQFAAMAKALSDANAVDANVAFLRGLAELNLPGPEAAKSSEQFLRAASEAGHRQASILFGRLLVKPPQGIAKDLTRGRSLIEDAAAAGDRLAQRLAGIAYLSGEFGVVNAAKARTLFHSAAEAGDAPAMLFYAFMLSWALGGPADQPAAADFLHRAAATGLTRAQDTLGVWLLDRYKQKAIDDPREGVEWLERAYRRGYSMRALNALALFYGDQSHPPPWNDKNKVSELANLCSGLNNPWCQAENGWAFQLGVGRNRDLVKAFAHYQVAIELGYANAAKSLQAIEGLMKGPAEKTAAVELSQTIRANLKPLASMWAMQYVGAEPPPSTWAAATYNEPSATPAAPLVATTPTVSEGSSIVLRRRKEPAVVVPAQTSTAPAAHSTAAQPNVDPAPPPVPAPATAGSIILRKPN